MALPGEGYGGGHLDSEEEEAPGPMQNIPEDLESLEVRWHFSTSLEPVSSRSKGCAASPWLTQWPRPSQRQRPSPRDWGKVHHPRWELGGSAKDAALGEEDIIRLAQDQEETKVNLLELQGQVLWLVSDHNEGHDKFLTTAQSPADEPALGPPIPQELGSADKQGDPLLPLSEDLWEVSLTDSVEPAPGEAREGSPHDSPTAQHIVQLLPLTQDSPGAPRFGQQPLHAILLTVLRSGR
ncbi:golgin subfamily A member 6B-like isoform X4 [Piliocolobus tephrosceles]|uniref:golgin subfamily A member 6B-like isoform X4 n=1 Tax=Piliocolobus tephrosceles TaxID=591936 RepID=UPI000E6AE647|nr:golgin subfamily A member 6B-like isoform X4 [Piliocolobus tephrosceles]